MSAPLVELVPSTRPSQLGILHLKRYWAKTKAKRLNQLANDAFEEELPLDAALLNALDLGLEPTIQYLFQVNPTFPEFEEWIMTSTGGPPHPDKVALFNARLLGTSSASSSPLTQATTTLSAQDLAHWQTYGYVVIKKAVSRQDCDQTIDLICDFLQLDRYDPQTWYAPHPYKQGIMIQLFSHPLLTKNRESPRIRRAYEQLWGRSDLWVSTDRVGFNPPQTTHWHFPGPRLHWDVRLDRAIPFGVQGLLYLSDTPSHQGAFTLVPAFQHHIEAWLAHLPPHSDAHAQNLDVLGPTPIEGEAGDFIIWHHALPHGSSVNRGDAPRFVQYINYAP